MAQAAGVRPLFDPGGARFSRFRSCPGASIRFVGRAGQALGAADLRLCLQREYEPFPHGPGAVHGADRQPAIRCRNLTQGPTPEILIGFNKYAPKLVECGDSDGWQ